MRLIDADELIDEMKKWYWDKEKQRAAELDNSPMDLFTNLAIVTVKEQSTAYDIDKIVEELEKLKHYNLSLGDAICDIYENGVDRHFVCLEEAIEIVKRGGKE